MTNYTVHT